MKKIVEMYKCPNCQGKLEKTDDANVLRCMFCGTEFETEDSEPEEVEVKEEEVKEEAKEEAKKYGEIVISENVIVTGEDIELLKRHEAMEEEEIKILTALFVITDS